MRSLALACSLSCLFLDGCRNSATDTPAELNDYVVSVLETYPTDGSCGYYWPREASAKWAGNVRDMSYRGEVLAHGDPERRSYCCGLTFEVWFFAYKAALRNRGEAFAVPGFPDSASLVALRKQWFGADGDKRCSDHALTDNGLGYRVQHADARRGDFVQLWRRSGSGHSAIFIDWVRKGGEIVGLRYWSSQKSTRGIGYREELFTGPKGVDRDRLWITRAVIS